MTGFAMGRTVRDVRGRNALAVLLAAVVLVVSLSSRALWLDPWEATPAMAALGLALVAAGQVAVATLLVGGIGWIRQSEWLLWDPVHTVFRVLVIAASATVLLSASVRMAGAWREYRHAYSDLVLFRPFVGVSADGTAISVRGEIVTGMATRFAAVAKARPDLRNVRLMSTGGVLNEGMGIAAEIVSRGLSTEVVALCASACTMAFVGGRERVVREGDVVVFHGTYLDVFGFSVDTAAPDKKVLFAGAGVSPWFIEQAVRDGHGNEWMPTAREMLEGGYATFVAPPWQGAAPLQ